MQLFYFPQATLTTDLLSLEKEDTRHITKVLRKSVGDTVSITNGLGDLFDGTITQLTSNRCDLQLVHIKKIPAPNPQLHIAIAPTKMNDRMEWFLEKSTELGVSSITPILCANSERRHIKMERFEKIIVSAMKQSLQLHKPMLNPLTGFEDFITSNEAELKLIAHCEETDKIHLSELLKPNLNTCILIGPEGDFNPTEIKNALNNNFRPVHLGHTRLRTETAGMYAVSLFNSIIQG
ncbi:16S rRNA (uracil(1498)-N(3))-methyltransferase [Nonlabens antarcticus]|uniref:16S rRNA (uracil(1498)-N(3))-methyltransferase n=1 Tax=Nonlabens antarcticus TaxID=392714 RepID=UPI0018915FDA|nr:16S rRNA (uracil(1498)-N(3))-methyltransferase [Nonlabens antarcticus]